MTWSYWTSGGQKWWLAAVKRGFRFLWFDGTGLHIWTLPVGKSRKRPHLPHRASVISAIAMRQVEFQTAILRQLNGYDGNHVITRKQHVRSLNLRSVGLCSIKHDVLVMIVSISFLGGSSLDTFKNAGCKTLVVSSKTRKMLNEMTNWAVWSYARCNTMATRVSVLMARMCTSLWNQSATSGSGATVRSPGFATLSLVRK